MGVPRGSQGVPRVSGCPRVVLGVAAQIAWVPPRFPDAKNIDFQRVFVTLTPQTIEIPLVFNGPGGSNVRFPIVL